MKPEDIQRIERVLGLKVPESYAQVVLNYPCPDVEDVCWHGLYSDPQRVIDVNLEHRKDGWFDTPWPAHKVPVSSNAQGSRRG